MERKKKAEEPVIERTKETPLPIVDENEGKVFYKKVGGGSARLANRIIKPGEKVWLYPEQVPAGMRDLFVPLSNIPHKKETPIVVDITKSEYKLQQRTENSPWYDIIGPEGKLLNDKALTKKKAEEFIQDMMQ